MLVRRRLVSGRCSSETSQVFIFNGSLRVDTLSRLSTSNYLERLSVERPGIQRRSVETPADNHSANAAMVKDAKVRVLYTIADIDDR